MIGEVQCIAVAILRAWRRNHRVHEPSRMFMIRKSFLLLYIASAPVISSCSIVGMGLHGSDIADRFIGTRFTNPDNPKYNPQAQAFYSRVAQGMPWYYAVHEEGEGKRYYIYFDYERCKMSLLVGRDDIIKSWRDENGTSSMRRCALR